MKEADQDLEIARSVLTLGKQIIQSRNSHLRELGLTAEQADALLYFSRDEDVTTNDLKNHLRIRHQTASGIVSRLAEKGLVVLVTSERDARAKNVQLTDRAREVLEIMKNNRTHTVFHMTRLMSTEERQQFIVLLAKATESL